jgi:acetyl esterase/lipase
MGTKRRALIGALVAMVLISAAACNRPGRPGRSTTTRPAPPTTGAPGPTTGRYVTRVFDGIDQVATGVAYKDDLRFDAWAPTGDPAAKRPAIVWGFGGGFIAGNRAQMNGAAQDSARRGYVGITIDYRLQTGGGVLAMAGGIMPAYEDTAAAIRWLREHADTYRIDPDAIIAGGVSAGAINAINAVVLPGTRGPASGAADAAISLSGASASALICAYLGNATCASDSKPNQGPILMFSGSADPIVLYPAQQATCANHRAAGNVCDQRVTQGAGHGPVPMSVVLDEGAAFVMREVLIPKGYAASG